MAAPQPSGGPGLGRAPSGEDDALPDPRQLMAQMELVQRELGRAQARLETLEAALVEANQAAATLRALGDIRDAEVLVPVGSGVHLHAKLVPGARPIVPVGAGYAVEASPQAALATLERRVQDMTETFNQTADRAEQLARVGGQINQALSGAGGDEGDDHTD